MGIVRPQKVTVNWSYCDVGWYLDRGYGPCRAGTTFEVDVDDLPHGSGRKVEVQCDYCGRTFSKTYQNLFNHRYPDAQASRKVACAKCQQLKTREVVREVYGVDHMTKLESTKAAARATFMDRYGVPAYAQTEEYLTKCRATNRARRGVDFPTQSPEVLAKRRATCRERFGGDTPMASPEAVARLRCTLAQRTDDQRADARRRREETNLERYGVRYAYLLPEARQAMHEALGGTAVPSSRQQRWLCTLLNGVLNHPVGGFFVDIAFPDERVYIEYDGSGHDLWARRRGWSMEQFAAHQLGREAALAKLGWRVVRVVSRHDLLPSASVARTVLTAARGKLRRRIVVTVEDGRLTIVGDGLDEVLSVPTRTYPKDGQADDEFWRGGVANG